ncbi:MAG: alpha-amylase family glycosyl hydrolase [Tahibacter sp.]
MHTLQKWILLLTVAGDVLHAVSAIAAESAGVPATIVAPRDASLHVASPDWRDQIIYFAMIDRFDNGDRRNDDQGTGEYDPADGAKFSGGDLAGLARRIAYIHDLGATAVWITPPVANRWWDARSHYGGYHGYWAENFVEVDRHFGSLADYRNLSRQLHAAGMFLIQDIVLNHTANYFSYGDKWKIDNPAQDYIPNPDGSGRRAPTQSPFDRNDPRDPAQGAVPIYHWTPSIKDFNSRQQELNWQLADLDDLNTENSAVRNALRASYAYWMEQVGVDAFRVDTAFYVPLDFLRDFLYSKDPQSPGILRVAERLGQNGFHVFGEGFGVERAYDDRITKKIELYQRGSAARPPAMPGMLNFPLYGAMTDVFARGHPTAELAYRIRRMMSEHQRPALMPSFVDNHDVDRFLAGGSEAGLRQALLMIMTLPGIPAIYYGTEQGFRDQRAAMFATGFGAGGRDHFDTSAPLYRYLQRVVALRRDNRLLSRGVPSVLQSSATGPGVLAYTMRQENNVALVAINSADHEVLMDNLDTGLAAGTRLHGVFGIDTPPADIDIDRSRRFHVKLPARATYVWLYAEARVAPRAAPAPLVLDALPAESPRENLPVHGLAIGAKNVQLVIDGDLGSAQSVRPDADGRWRIDLDTQGLSDATVEHRLVAWSPQTSSASVSRRFRVNRHWTTLIDVDDPANDDHGPQGQYAYPTDPGWREHHQLDLRGVRVSAAGRSLKIELRLREVLALWNAPNGFDHVAFTVFVQRPGSTSGVRTMPLQHADVPGELRWDLRIRAGGWVNALFSADGASATQEGSVIVPAAELHVDAASGTVSFTLPATALGESASWSGARIYVTTWDYDGGYRGLAPDAQSATFGGGDGAKDPLYMDDSAVIVVP